MSIDSTIFRLYDIRGEVDKNFTEDVVNAIGRSYAIYLKNKFKERTLTVSVARDIRLHSEKLKDALTSGILSEGVNVIDLGVCPTPVLYFSLFKLPVEGGIMITGSHNPPEFNGMKVCVGKETIYGEEIQKLYKIAKDLFAKPSEKGGELSYFDILSDYEKFLLNEFRETFQSHFHTYSNSSLRHSEHISFAQYKLHEESSLLSLQKPVKVAIDSGNGCAGLIVPNLLKKLGVDVVELYSEPDGHFPNHHPDPTLIETLTVLRKTVKDEKADFGIAYDGDVDRIGVVDENGNVVYGDKLTYIFAKDILKSHPGGKIIGEVKCSKTLFDGVKKLGGIPILSPVGHSLIKKKLKEENALLAGEMSGHIFFNDRYFGYDDAIYATLRLIEIYIKEKSKNSNFKFSDLLKDLPPVYVSEEIRIDCKEEEKFALVDSFLDKFKNKFPKLAQKIWNVITIDGVRIEFSDGWGLIRASNTQPVLVMRFEATTKEALEEYKQSFKLTLGGNK